MTGCLGITGKTYRITPGVEPNLNQKNPGVFLADFFLEAADLGVFGRGQPGLTKSLSGVLDTTQSEARECGGDDGRGSCKISKIYHGPWPSQLEDHPI